MTNCDFCSTSLAPDGHHYVMSRRPSDPTEFVCILYLCEDCANDGPHCDPHHTSAWTQNELEEFFDSGKARKEGLLFLSY